MYEYLCMQTFISADIGGTNTIKIVHDRTICIYISMYLYMCVVHIFAVHVCIHANRYIYL
jgi:hypothetical protein